MDIESGVNSNHHNQHHHHLKNHLASNNHRADDTCRKENHGSTSSMAAAATAASSYLFSFSLSSSSSSHNSTKVVTQTSSTLTATCGPQTSTTNAPRGDNAVSSSLTSTMHRVHRPTTTTTTTNATPVEDTVISSSSPPRPSGGHKRTSSSTAATATILPEAPGSCSKDPKTHGTNATTSCTAATTSAAPNNNNSKPERAPVSSGMRLPLTHIVANLNNKAHQQQTKTLEPQLVHPILSNIPIQFRFGFTGLLSNVLFMGVYNWSVEQLSHVVPASAIYGILYFVFIPASHFLLSLFVFGWPERYIKSLASNFPIGLTALAIGCLLTAYLDEAGFNDWVTDYIRDFFTFSTMPARREEGQPIPTNTAGEWYSSMVVLAVTSLWTYVLSVYVNGPPTKAQKKD